MEKKLKVLNNLIKEKSFDNFEDIIDHIKKHTCAFNLEIIDIIINDIIDLYKNNISNVELFHKYQLLINAIINNSQFEVFYNSKAKVPSLLEMVRVLALVFQDETINYLGGCLNVTIRIVEVNKRGLKIKHFAYQSEYKIHDLVYVGKCQPSNFHVVTDAYEVKLKNLLRYIVYVSCDFVHKFDISYVNIAKYNISKIKDQKTVRIMIGDEEVLCSSDYDLYVSQRVEVLHNQKVRFGYVLGDVFFSNNTVSSKIIKPLPYKKILYQKEKRELTDETILYLFKGWNITSFIEAIQEMNRTKYVIMFSVFERLIYMLEENKHKMLNEIEDLNIYYRPFLNYLINNIDLNSFYYKNNGVNFSILYYLSILKRQEFNSLIFLIDKQHEFLINVIEINVYGVIKKCFAYDKDYKIGEPVFINLEDTYPIAFVHDAKKIKLHELLEEIEFYSSNEITQIMNLQQIVQQRSVFNNKVILVKVYDGKKTQIVISKNYVPYIGESVKLEEADAIVITEPVAVEKDHIDVSSYPVLKQ